MDGRGRRRRGEVRVLTANLQHSRALSVLRVEENFPGSSQAGAVCEDDPVVTLVVGHTPGASLAVLLQCQWWGRSAQAGQTEEEYYHCSHCSAGQ